jgi:hypothetical protein
VTQGSVPRSLSLGKVLHSLSARRKLLHSRHPDDSLVLRSVPEKRS